MGSDFPIFEIIIFGMIAAFFVLRLKNTLGKRTGHEQEQPPTRVRPNGDARATQPSPQETEDNVIRLPGAEAPRPAADDFDPERATPLEQTLHAIGQADATFDPRGFVQGARGAYEMIVTAFAQGDKKTLKPLLASAVMKNFAAAIDARKAEGLTMESELVGFNKVEIVAAELENSVAEVGVKFEAEMISVTRDRNGEIVEGNDEDVIQMNEIWTFARDTRSRNPNWELLATRSST